MDNYRSDSAPSREFVQFRTPFNLTEWDEEVVSLLDKIEWELNSLKSNHSSDEVIWKHLTQGETSILFRLKKLMDLDKNFALNKRTKESDISKYPIKKKIRHLEGLLEDTPHYNHFKVYFINEYSKFLKSIYY